MRETVSVSTAEPFATTNNPPHAIGSARPAQFNRWRPDRDSKCTYAQLDQPVTLSLGDIVPGLAPDNA